MTDAVGRLHFGDRGAQIVSTRIAGYFATTTALAALAPSKRNPGMLAVVGQTLYVFDADAVTGGVEPSTGTGRWVSSGTIAQGISMVRVATAAALAANTRTANVLTADANGAMGTIDGATMVVGERVLVKDESTGANNGIYVVTSLGGASAKWTMTRAPDMDASAEVISGMLVVSSEGSVGANATWMLTTNSPITVNTTALTFGAVGTATASDSTPAALGTATAGVATSFSRSDHAHATPFGSRTVTVGHADLTDSTNGEAQAINISTALPANAVVVGHALTAITPFSGGSVSECKMDVGGTDADAIVNALELITDAPSEAELAAARGVLPQGSYTTQQLTATFTPDAGHALAGLTAGSVTITVWYFTLA